VSPADPPLKRLTDLLEAMRATTLELEDIPERVWLESYVRRGAFELASYAKSAKKRSVP
jgi:hypothetical protein